MGYERERYHQREDCKIHQRAGAYAPAFPLIAKEIYRRGDSESMDENRTHDCAYANHQRKKNRELMILRHLFHQQPRIRTSGDVCFQGSTRLIRVALMRVEGAKR
jgi:hypothetical protein